jgi:hypothetical protein
MISIASSVLKRSLWNQTAKENTGVHGRTPRDPAISRLESPSAVHRRSFPKHDTATRSMKTCNRQISILAWETNPRTTAGDDPLGTASRGCRWKSRSSGRAAALQLLSQAGCRNSPPISH